MRESIPDLKGGKKIDISIRARMGSSRLPGKVLKEVNGRAMLEIMLERVRRSEYFDDLVVATSLESRDDAIVELCKKNAVRYFRGSEDDVLERVYLAHKELSSDIVVSICGDCPLTDPEIIDNVILSYLANEPCDYATNLYPKLYPKGMELEVFPFRILEHTEKHGKTPEDRECVTHFFRSRPDMFKHIYVAAPPNLTFPDLTVLLDEEDDLKLISEIIKNLYPKKNHFTCRDIIEFIKLNSSLLELNKNVKRKIIGNADTARRI
ncbi:MAG: glycosyltransferase family protein [Candidatus Omnitrophica bacterium]|nr:glycosyltransferase family protein [Candidatus Omnitrophota bacterium]